MQTKERRLTECEFVLLLENATDEAKREMLDLLLWIEANSPTDDELTAEIERRKGA